jgi:hypothetical protein
MRATLATVVLCATLTTGCGSSEPLATQSPAPGPDAGTASPSPAPQATAVQTPAPQQPVAPPAAAPVERMPKLPDPRTLPPIPELGFAPPRPIEEVRSVYRFAALHPEVMRYVPCFCGCERNGHQDNEDCFVRSRAADGSVTWEPHGFS